MKNIFPRAFIFAAIISCAAAINPKDLIKVTNETEQACVEYFDYQGQMYCSTKALTPQKVDAKVRDYETQIIVFDHRPWQIAWGEDTDRIKTVEYVPLGDDINNWHELVTSQFFPGLQRVVTPKEFADKAMSGLEESGFKPKVTFISETPTSIIFEFQIDSPSKLVQNEIQKITQGKDGLHVLHYVVKKSDMGAEARKTWVKNLSGSTLISE